MVAHKLVDVHCHLNHQQFKNELDKVLQRASKAGVKRIVISGVNPTANKEVLQLVNSHPEILSASLGIYPINALGLAEGEGETGLPRHIGKIDLEKEFKFIKEAINQNKDINKNKNQIVSIGEIGMDFHWVTKEDTGKQQEENFRKIIRFALSVKKPIIIHSREAEEECLDILAEEIRNKEIFVVMHCFSGKKSLMSRAIEQGYYFSIPPLIVRSTNFQVLAKKAPLAQLLTETDAPWLSPFKDRKNEPAYVIETIRKIAEIKGVSEQEVADQIWQNYLKVFERIE